MRNLYIGAIFGALGFLGLLTVDNDFTLLSVAFGWYLIAVYAIYRLIKLRDER